MFLVKILAHPNASETIKEFGKTHFEQAVVPKTDRFWEVGAAMRLPQISNTLRAKPKAGALSSMQMCMGGGLFFLSPTG